MSKDCKQKIWIKAKKELLAVNTESPLKDRQVVTVPSFDEADDWKGFHERLERYFIDNGVQNDRQVPILLTSISEPVYDVLKNLCRSELPTKKSFKQLTDLLSKHFSENPFVRRNRKVWKERIKFFKMKQGNDNDAFEWYDRLQQVASGCDFGSFLEEHVRNMFICGMKSGPVQDRLMQAGPLTSCAELIDMVADRETRPGHSNYVSPVPANKHLMNVKSPLLPRRSPRSSFKKQSNKENYWRPKAPGYSQSQGFTTYQPSHYKWGNQDGRDDRRGTKRPHNGDDDDDDDDNAPAPTCICGLPAKKLTVRREGPNQGRDFFVCPKDDDKCSLYTWADEVSLEIKCHCQLTAKKMTVRKEGFNQGRQFYGCPKLHGSSDRCQFFVWADEAESGNYRGNSGGGGRGGGGGGGSGHRGRGSFTGGSNSRSSSGGRSGRGGSGPSSAKKPKAPPKPPSNFKATGSKDPPKVRKCGICSQPGHNRKNCPQNGG